MSTAVVVRGDEMLEFIVLGQVPGTQIQLTFQEVLLFTLITVIVLKLTIKQLVARYVKHGSTTSPDNQPTAQAEPLIIHPSRQQQA